MYGLLFPVESCVYVLQGIHAVGAQLVDFFFKFVDNIIHPPNLIKVPI